MSRLFTQQKFAVFLASMLIISFFIISTNAINAEPINEKWSPAEKKLLSELSNYLQNLQGLESRFIQISPQGETVEGQLLYRHPKQLKFTYDAPQTQIIKVDGGTLYVQDAPGETPATYPVSATPLPLFFDHDTPLVDQAALVSLIRSGGLVELLLRDPKGETPGRLYMALEISPPVLRGWRVIDAQGQTTSVLLRDLVHRNDIDDQELKLDYRRKRGPRR